MAFLRISNKGQSLIEVILAMSLLAVLTPALVGSLATSRDGQAQQKVRIGAVAYLQETQEAVRSIREKGWDEFAVNGTFHPAVDSTTHSWKFLPNSETNARGLTRSVVISNVLRNTSGAIVTSGGTVDPSTKMLTITVSWTLPKPASTVATMYIARTDNLSTLQTTKADFDAGTLGNTQTTNTSGGEVILANNNKAKWCSPAFSSATIDLPDGPPVAVSASSHPSDSSKPNKVYVATAPSTGTSIKMAYLDVTANSDPPVPTLKGTFTLDPSKYSNPSYVPTGIGLDNTFKTNDVRYYTSPAGKVYALLATDLPSKEVIAIQVNDGVNDTYQDPVNKIYKYWTFFNTKIYGPASTDTGFKDPTANAAQAGGDGDGYGTNPTRAYTDNTQQAVDTNSGNGTGTSCTGSDKDKHRFYNYGFSIPSGANINGIEVRLDAKVDNNAGNPKMCVDLSWDGGTTWTTAKSTTSMTTSEVTYTLGGPVDTWGQSWTSTHFSNANFRVRVTDVSSDVNRDFSLDWVATKVYYNTTGAATNDQAPFDYGGVSLTVLGNTGYVISGGYLYAFDLSSIDNKTTSSGLDMLGCRIQLDGYDCKPGTGTDKKYNAGETGTSWSDTTTPAHNDCSDGGNIELNADNDIYPVQVGGNTYIFTAVGAGTNPEFNISNVSSVPTYSTSPAIDSNSCGRASGGNAGWKTISSYDFNSQSNTEEAANSVFATTDGSRAYISSNGGIDGNHDGQPDSYAMYILNTSNKSSPAFLSGTPSTGATSGYYYPAMPYRQLYPRRSLTVLNGQRAVLVGKDGVSDGNDAQEYQVANIDNEASPAYCGGINFDSGFNDLTSVSEADGDNFVYMVANTLDKQLKIIQGGPDSGIYVDSGTFESSAILAANSAFNALTAHINKPANTDIKVQVGVAQAVAGSCSGASYTFLGPNGDSSQYFTTTTDPAYIRATVPFLTTGSYTNPGSCFKYKAWFTTTDTSQTPTFYDAVVNYSP